MIRTRLTYHSPSQIEEACALLDEHGDDAAVLGGGTHVLPMMARGERSVGHVVDLRRLNLTQIVAKNGEVEVGAMVAYTDVLSSPLLRNRAPLLPMAAAGITGGAQIRNVGTIGGSASYATPSSDVPGCLVALGARMRVRGPSGAREVSAQRFFVDAFRPDLGRGQILTAIVLPEVAGRVGYYKLKLSESSWPIATAAAMVDNERQVASATLGGVCRTPLQIDLSPLIDGEGRVRTGGPDLDDYVREQLGELYGDELAPESYRQNVAGVVARRALEQSEEVYTGHE